MIWELAKNKAGNFSITTAFIMLPLVGMAGMSVDLTNAYTIKSGLQQAADSAALGAISEKSPAVKQAFQMATDGTITLGQADAVKIFKSQFGETTGYSNLSVTAQVTKTGRNVTSKLTYSAQVQTNFMKIVGKRSVTLSGSATATYDTQTFRDFYLLLDNTPSMGVAATPADVTKMVNNTSDKCAFACHIVNNGVENKSDYYNLAKKLGVTIRIDVVAKATAALMDTATAQRSTSDQYRMAIYTFGEKAEDTKLLEVSPLTVDLVQAKKKAAAIQLMTIPAQGYNNDQQTSFDTALTQIKTKMGTQGTGASATNTEKVVFFVADGVGDSYKPTGCTKATTSGRCQEPIDTKYCDALKAANYKIAVLYTTYLPLPTNGWYNSWIAPFQSQIPTRMKACASDGLYFEVSPTQGIADAMNALFMKVVNTPRLTT